MLLICYYIRDFILFLVDKIVSSLHDFKLLFNALASVIDRLFNSVGNIVNIAWFWIPVTAIIGLIIFFRVYALLPTLLGGGGNGQ